MDIQKKSIIECTVQTICYFATMLIVFYILSWRVYSKRGSTVPASAVKATPAKGHAMPPHPPLGRTVATSSSHHHHAAAAMPAVPECEDVENYEPERDSNGSSNISSHSRESEGTTKTSLTQIRERPLSTDSHTVVRVPLA